jgi:hypothetical protein
MLSSIIPTSAPSWRRTLIGLCVLVVCFAPSAGAQYPNPVPTVPGGGITSLVGIGSVSQISPTGFRLTPSFRFQRGAVWMINKQFVAGGFQSTFQFRISNPGGLIESTPFGFQQGGDGFAFVIQNFGIPVVGPPAGYLGYHGLPNSLAVEFDTWQNFEPGFLDPNGNHVSVHSRGLAANSVSEAASLGRTTAIPFLKDGAPHMARIDYTPGILRVFVDTLAAPVLTIPGFNLASQLSLDNGTAWVGFTSGTGSTYETHDILRWEFGQTGTPVVVTGPFPVTATPSTPMPTTPTAPYILPPAPTNVTNGTTSP